MTETLIAQAILLKLNRAMDSLVPQAYGRGDLELCGVYLNRGRLFVLIGSLPILVAILYAKNAYLALDQDPKVIDVMDRYLRAYIPGIYFFVFSDLQRKFLTGLGRTRLPMLCFLAVTFLHPYMLRLFCEDLDLGFEGIGYAGCATNLLALILLLTISFVDEEVRQALHFPDSRAFYGHWE